ncbi:Centromere/kinetochore Zw10-domain-containing protein [Obelidium mucronatum]|nr:Centromere/kinetochore Zw10-domain-containing protein [Obelidium mucronatum]
MTPGLLTTVLDATDGPILGRTTQFGLAPSIEQILRTLHLTSETSDDEKVESPTIATPATLDRIVLALERRLKDVQNEIHDEITSHASEYQQLVSSAFVQEQEIRSLLLDLKSRVVEVQNPVTGLLVVRKTELENTLASIRSAQTEERLRRISDSVEAFKESVEACRLILTEFGDLADAVDTLCDLELKLSVIADCDEVIPRSTLESIFNDVRSIIVQRVEDAFSNVFLIQGQENGSVSITTKSAVRVSNPETPSQPIFVQTEALLNIIQSLNIHITLYSSLSRSLMKLVLKSIILNPSCTIVTSTSVQQLDSDSITVGHLEVHYNQPQTGDNRVSDAFSKLLVVFKFISSTFFVNTTPPHDLVQSIWQTLASTIIDHLLTPMVPTTPESLQLFPGAVASPCTEFENSMESISWISKVVLNGKTNSWRHLSGYCGSVETYYCIARWEKSMALARDEMIRENFDIIPVGEGGSDMSEWIAHSIKTNDTLSSFGDVSDRKLSLVYPVGSTGADALESLLRFPRCSISSRASKIIQLLENVLKEATADGVSAYCASRFYLLSRDLLTLHLSLTPIKYASHLRNLPQLSMIYHNDCLYFSHYLLTLAPRVRYGLSTRFGASSLLKESEVNYVDLAAKFRNSGMSIFNSQLMLQKTNIMELIASSNGLGMGDTKRAVEVQKMLAQVMHTVRQLCSVWAPPLSPTFFHTRLVATMAGWVLSAVVNEIESAIDIGDEESHRLNEALHKLERSCTILFYGDSNGEEISAAEYDEGQKLLRQFLGPSFTKFRKLKEMLVMSFAGIMDLFRGGRGGDSLLHPEEDGGLDEFSNQELGGLVRALFSDTPLRQKNLAEIHSRK